MAAALSVAIVSETALQWRVAAEERNGENQPEKLKAISGSISNGSAAARVFGRIAPLTKMAWRTRNNVTSHGGRTTA